MPFNGSGIYEPIPAPDFPAVPLTTIRAAQYNAEILDIAQALGQCLTRTGEGPALADIPMGGFQLTGLGVPSAAGHALVFGQNGTLANITATGTVTAAGKVTASAGLDVAGNALVSGTLAMGSAFDFRNYLINGGAQVAQRSAANLINDTHVYGAVDRFTVFVSATTVTGGQAVKASVPGATKSGYALGGNAVSTTGNCNVRIQQRIEALNSVDLNAKVVTVSGKYYQNTGASITMNVGLSKPNVADTWPVNGTGVTTVGSIATFVAPSGVWTPFAVQITVGASDATGGLAAYVATPLIAALTNKEFYWGDAQLEEGSVATPFENRPCGLELALCQRYLPSAILTSAHYKYFGQCFTANSAQVYIPFLVESRVPSTSFTASASVSFGNALGSVTGTAVLASSTTKGVTMGSSGCTGLVAGNATGLLGGAAFTTILFEGCEL